MKLYKYQIKGVRKIHHFKGRVLLADEMGLGKTIEALQWLKESQLSPAIVVCPASLKWVWEMEASYRFGMRSEVLNGRLTATSTQLVGRHPLLIINYEILQYWLDWLLTLNPQILIVDECHFIKNLKAARTKAVRKLGKAVPHILALSGTPLTNRPAELWPTLNLIRPDKYPALWPFRWRYCDPKKMPWAWEFKGASHLDELHQNLSAWMMIRRLKSDVLTELPAKTRQVIPMQIENEKDYQEAVNNFIKWLTKISAAKAKRAKQAQKLVQMGYLKRLAAELKMVPVLSWIDNFLEESGGKLVLYCIHKNIIKQLHDKYKSISVVVDGGVPGKKRKMAVQSFQNNKQIRLFIGNIQAAGVGINLNAASSLAFVEMDWLPSNHTQAEARPHRIGQKEALTIYYLVAKGTIEELLCQIIQKKQAVLSEVMDGGKEINELDIYNQLEKTLLKGI